MDPEERYWELDGLLCEDKEHGDNSWNQRWKIECSDCLIEVIRVALNEEPPK